MSRGAASLVRRRPAQRAVTRRMHLAQWQEEKTMASVAPAGQETGFRQLGEFIEAEMARLHVPGVAVGVLHDGQERYGGYGVTSV